MINTKLVLDKSQQMQEELDLDRLWKYNNSGLITHLTLPPGPACSSPTVMGHRGYFLLPCYSA